ncbi:MAG: adenosylcobinamide-GDP ribazoletransferase [Chloroflexi bacterium]|nr:adenosylcobinamide-GDP ribazoletransferase [Chloroflexota bacterium]
MRNLLTALGFLTVVPVPEGAGGAEEFGRSFPYFPVVGLFLGGVLVLLNYLLGLVFAPVVVNALLVVALVVLTGGLHVEGLMDSCDGILNSSPPERRLEIMKDSRVGAFGVLGAVSALLLKFATISVLAGDTRVVALLIAPVLSRWAMVFAALHFPYGRAGGGLGSLFLQTTGRNALLVATSLAVVLAALLWQVAGLLLLILVLLVTYGGAKFVMRRIPGLTGDVYGAINEVCEVVVLLAAPLVAAYLPWAAVWWLR